MDALHAKNILTRRANHRHYSSIAQLKTAHGPSRDPDHRGSQSACAGCRSRGEHRGAQQAGQTGIAARLAGSMAHPADGGGRGDEPFTAAKSSQALVGESALAKKQPACPIGLIFALKARRSAASV
jgi:hypothetical protein